MLAGSLLKRIFSGLDWMIHTIVLDIVSCQKIQRLRYFCIRDWRVKEETLKKR